MKKLLFICIVSLCTTIQTKAQLPDTTNVNRFTIEANSLFKKAKKQQATALILLLTGTIITTASLIAVQEEGIFTDNFATYGAIILAGGATMLSSIPFFIASGKNKR